jgi:hypothetical protein
LFVSLLGDLIFCVRSRVFHGSIIPLYAHILGVEPQKQSQKFSGGNKMPVQEFALDATGSQRIQVHWASDSDPASVLLNSSLFGSLATLEERTAGKDFTLPDGSSLHVRFVNNQPQALRNGYPLAVAPTVSKISSQRKRGGCLTTWLILNLVVVSGLTLLYFLDIAGSAVLGSSASISPGVFLLFALLGCVGIVGLSALLAWKKWGFYLVALYVVLNIVLAFPLGLFNGIRTFTPLIGLAALYYLLRRNDVWEHLT